MQPRSSSSAPPLNSILHSGSSSTSTTSNYPPASTSTLSLHAASSALAGALTHSALLGIALVVSGDFGTRTSFRYPVPQVATSGGKGKAGAGAGGSNTKSSSGNASGDDGDFSNGNSVNHSPALGPRSISLSSNASGGGGKGDSSDDDASSSKLPPQHGSSSGGTGATSSNPASHMVADDMYGLTSDEFARLFCPKLSLCSRTLDVSIDGLRFLSHPIRLRLEEDREVRNGRRRRRAMYAAKERVNANLAGREASSAHIQAGDAPHAVDAAEQPSSSSVAVMDDPLLDEGDSDDEDTYDDADAAVATELTFFNVVFILNGGVSQDLATSYGHVAGQLARALLHEQTRCRFVSIQAQMQVSMREKYMNALTRAGVNNRPGGGVGGSTQPGNKQPVPDYHALSHLLLSHSLLANHLYQLYYSLLQQEYELYGLGNGVAGISGIEDTHGLASTYSSIRQTIAGMNISGGGTASSSVSAQANGTTITGASGNENMNTMIAAAFMKLGNQISSSNNAGAAISSTSATTAANTSQQQLSSTTVAKNAAMKLLQADHSHTTILLNNWMPLHFSLAPLPQSQGKEKTAMATAQQHHHEKKEEATATPSSPATLSVLGYPTVDSAEHHTGKLRPYQTLLLTVSAPTLLSSLPSDASPLLRSLISHADPRVSFSDLASSILHTSLSHVYHLVEHLTYWNKGIVINAIQGDNIYIMSHKAWCVTTGISQAAKAKKATSGKNVTVSIQGKTVQPGRENLPPASAVRRATSGASSSSSSHPSSSSSRNRSSNPSDAPPVILPSFLPATFVYDWCLSFPQCGVTGLIAILTRMAGREYRTVTQHLQRLTATITNLQANNAAASSSATTTTATVLLTQSTSSLKRTIHAEFLSQLIFLIKKRWLIQVEYYLVRINLDEFDNEEDDDEEDEDREEQDDDDEESALESDGINNREDSLLHHTQHTTSEYNQRGIGLSHSNSARSLRSLDEAKSERMNTSFADSTSTINTASDPWRALFQRLTRASYFDGKHCVNEILWCERETGLTLQHLQHLITLYPKQLIWTMHT